MASTTTLIGNTTSDVELRYTQSGRAVANVTIAVNERRRKDDGTYEDGEAWFARCVAWGDLGEHLAASVEKGLRVVAFGRIGQKEWTDKEGQKRTSVEVTLDAVGPDLRYATAQVTRTSAGGNRGGGKARGPAQDAGGWSDQPAAWAADASSAPF